MYTCTLYTPHRRKSTLIYTFMYIIIYNIISHTHRSSRARWKTAASYYTYIIYRYYRAALSTARVPPCADEAGRELYYNNIKFFLSVFFFLTTGRLLYVQADYIITCARTRGQIHNEFFKRCFNTNIDSNKYLYFVLKDM